MTTRIFDRARKSGGLSALGAGTDQATFSSAGVASVSDATEFIQNFSGVEVLGSPGVDSVKGTAGNGTTTITVPTGKYWRLIGMGTTLITDANAANRQVVLTLRTAADATIETLTAPIQTASVTDTQFFLFGSNANCVGDAKVAASCELTIAEAVIEDDDMLLDTITWVFKDTLTGAAYEIAIGADEAATKVNIPLCINGGQTIGTHGGPSYDVPYTADAAFVSDVLDIVMDVKGTAGNSIVSTETFNGSTNVIDATTFGTEVTGVDAALTHSASDFPEDSGAYLTAGEDILVSVTLGVAGDDLDTTLFYVEYDLDIS